MRILFINNDGAGFADYIEIALGTSIRAFLEEKLPGQEASDLLIRVNRQPVPGDYILQDGDRISATPTKIAGASTI